MINPPLNRILLVEDEPAIQAVTRLALEEYGGFILGICSSGKQALLEAQSFNPDLILLDIMMPGMDGFSTLQALRQIPEMRETPVLFLTAKAKAEELLEYRQTGAIDIISKPFDPLTLPTRIKTLWTEYHQQRSNSTAIREKLQALKQEYGQQLPEKAREIAQLWERLQASGWQEELLITLHMQTHNLIGVGATLGFNDLSRTARALEICLRGMKSRPLPPAEQLRVQFMIYLEQLEEAAQQALGSLSESPEPQRYQHASHQPQDHRLIFLVGDRLQADHDLLLQIGYFGYRVYLFNDLAELKQSVQNAPPAAIIINMVDPAQSFAATEAVGEIQRSREASIPLIFISTYGDMSTRLHAVRAGASAFLIRPIDMGALIDKLDSLTIHHAPEPYRVLIVDDEPSIAETYAATLQQAGMLTQVVTEPMQVMQPVIEFRPDLILMDVYMPNCSGIDLARVIRQQEAYVSIPIVFLSVETDPDKQFAAMDLGGDDFLTKPIQAQHLISSVSARAQRSRILRTFMTCDSLTGLLNHTKTKEQLELEIARALRQNPRSTFSYAMIDLDHFKSINDTYGHLTGDRVIKSLARLLQQRLRKTDMIGRYGGEEFAVILTNTDGAAALKVLDEIRHGFAQIKHHAAGSEFSVTFSCGIATFPHYQDGTTLNDGADKALYEAKRSGRNQVVLAWD